MTHRPRLLRASAAVLLLLAAGARTVRAQDPRDAMVARAFNEFDEAKRAQLLMNALNPTAGPPRGAWAVGVQLLAQTLIEDKQDSIATVWLRWAIRLSPDLQPDTVQFLPQVVSAYRRARVFVLATRHPLDSLAATTWLWPGQGTGQHLGRLHIAPSGLPVPMTIQIKGYGALAAEASASLVPGSYEVTATAPGFDTIKVTREVLPDVTTVIEFHPHPLGAALAARPQPAPAPAAAPATPAPATAPPEAAPQKKGGFPIVLALIGVGGAAALAVVLAGGGSKSGSTGGGGGGGTTNFGSITITFPNP